MAFWKDKNVAITGGDGFIGSHLAEMLLAQGARLTIVGRDPLRNLASVKDKLKFVQGDLRDTAFTQSAFKDAEVVMHLAGLVRGVGFNAANPATMISENVRINASVLEGAAKTESVERLLFTSSACGYPLEAKVPLREEEFFNGFPEPSNAPYGWSKRLGEIECGAYAKQYGMRIAIVRPFNSYGPRDNFNPAESHVIPALIRRAVEKQDPFVVWGTGNATRAFIYVTDVAAGMMLACENYAKCDALNLGNGTETTIRELVGEVLAAAGHSSAKLVFDSSKPQGQPRRSASIEKAKDKIGFAPKVGLKEGLGKTVEWYLKNGGERK
jgi:GDP-L-fucose synthase